MKTWVVVPVACLCLLALASVAPAQDTEQTRFYINLRLGGGLVPDTKIAQGLKSTSFQQAIGGAVGVNLGQHWGVEIAGDGYEPDLSIPGFGKIGEYAIWTIMPQVRWRYPLLDGYLTPYVTGGVGLAFTEFNDRKPRAANLQIDAKDTAIAGALGLGIEYFVANNVAVGVEGKYLALRDQKIAIAGQSQKADLDTLLFTVSLRILFPEARPGRR